MVGNIPREQISNIFAKSRITNGLFSAEGMMFSFVTQGRDSLSNRQASSDENALAPQGLTPTGGEETAISMKWEKVLNPKP